MNKLKSFVKNNDIEFGCAVALLFGVLMTIIMIHLAHQSSDELISSLSAIYLGSFLLWDFIWVFNLIKLICFKFSVINKDKRENIKIRKGEYKEMENYKEIEQTDNKEK